MYDALWRILPGPAWLRALILVVLLLAAVYALFTWVFPWVSGIITPTSVTVNQ